MSAAVYNSAMREAGDDVKLMLELMRHAKITTTMKVYAQPGMENKRAAQRKAEDLCP
jgi:hypothetical protein